ncbi:MAG: hypothetical protein ABDH18_05945, partial [Aquificaceae bacterium]
SFSQMQEPFSRLVLRVSLPEANPVELVREGPINPGDIVTFNLTLPNGEERTIEAFLYDRMQRPVFYRSVFLPSLNRQTTVRIDLLPSERKVLTYELRSNGKLETKSKVFVYSEDLYSLNSIYDGFLIGKVVAVREGSRAFAMYFDEGNLPVELSFVREREFDVNVIAKDLTLSGSLKGTIAPKMKALSDSIAVDDSLLVCAKDSSSLYFSLGPSVSLSKVCSINQISDCLSITFTSPPGLSPKEPILRFSNITCDAGFVVSGQTQSKILTFPSIRGELLAGFNIDIRGDCLVKGFEHSKIPLPELKTASLELSSPSLYTIESTDGLFKLDINCIAKDKAKINFPYLENRQVVISRQSGKQIFSMISTLQDLKTFSPPDFELDLSIEDKRDHLFVTFPKRGNFSSCELHIFSKSLEIKVDKIPPSRSHLKIIKQGAFENLDSLQRAVIRCSFNNGFLQRELMFPAETSSQGSLRTLWR